MLKSHRRHQIQVKAIAVYHFLFWLILLGIMVSSGMNEMPPLQAVTTAVTNLAFFSAIVYFNWFYLFPRYMKEKNFIVHIGLLLATAVVLTPIKTLSLYYMSFGNTRLQAYYFQNQSYIFLSTFFIGLSATIYKIMTEWVIQQRDKKDLENKTLQSELKFLKSQINPHFLFNTLNSLYALTLKKSDLAPDMVLRLAEMMRYMLYECNEKEVLLQKEVAYLEHYIELEKLRHGGRTEIKFTIEGRVEKQLVAPLVFIPFLENAFKHGSSHQLDQGFVHLTLLINEDDIQMTLSNSKPNTGPKPANHNAGGIGLLNVQRRMDLLYPERYKLHIEESPNQYTVYLKLQLSPQSKIT